MARQTREGRRISDELLDELLAGQDPSEVFRDGSLIDDLKKAVAERALDAEMEAHLGHEAEQVSGNHRNGHNRKRVLTEDGALDLEVPRDRQGRFEPQLVEKYARRLPGFDDKVISMYARGMTTREIRAHIAERYGLTVSAELISKVTDAVLDEVAEWQSRPLEEVYAIVYFDAVRVKIRDEGLVRNKAVYLAIGVSCAGRKEVLGLWIEQTEGAKFWLSVMNELKTRGVGDVPDRGGGRAEGLSRCDRGGVSPGHGPDLPGAPHPALAGLRVVQGAPGTGRGAQDHLPGADRGRGTDRPGGPRGRCVGSEVSGHHAQLAQRLGTRGALPSLLAADPACDLHHQRNREPQQHGAPGGAHPGPLPQRPRRGEADLLGAAPPEGRVAGPSAVLAPSAPGVRDPLR